MIRRLLALVERAVTAMLTARTPHWDDDPTADIPTAAYPTTHVRVLPPPSPLFDSSYRGVYDDASFARWLRGGDVA